MSATCALLERGVLTADDISDWSYSCAMQYRLAVETEKLRRHKEAEAVKDMMAANKRGSNPGSRRR